VVDDAKQGCQNASKGHLKALYAPQFYPRLINGAQFIIYSFVVDVLGLKSDNLTGIVFEFIGIIFKFFHKKSRV
jgi:hypothetical protein